jgi:hypothetical protein
MGGFRGDVVETMQMWARHKQAAEPALSPMFIYMRVLNLIPGIFFGFTPIVRAKMYNSIFINI